MANSCKYYKQKKQVSYDGGQTWMDVSPAEYRKGGLYESNSPSCGGGITVYRWTNLDPSEDYYCSGTTKYYKQQKEQSTDGGVSWIAVYPAEYQIGTAYEQHSEDCIDYNNEYLTFIAREDGTFSFNPSQDTNKIQYSLDFGVTWTELASGASTPTVQSGKKIMWKGTMTPYSLVPTNGIGTFSATNNFDVVGNTMSLIYGDDFRGQTSLSGINYVFSKLFMGNDKVIKAEDMKLPATALTEYCYQMMFMSCFYLTSVPQLPATTLARRCYYGMFQNCHALLTVPSDLLPATTVARQCYDSMFLGCMRLATLPHLPSTNLSSGIYCYDTMFAGCSGITSIPSDLLPATTLSMGCYYGMFEDCPNLVSVPSNLLPATTLAHTCYYRMFRGCTSLTTAPQLPATTLATSCYNSMFRGCTSLTTAPTTLPATTLADYCYQEMFYNCTSLTTAPQLPATTLGEWCYNSMFQGCTSLTTAPSLPAATLTRRCYSSMFYGCSSLNSITCLATDITAYDCTANWVNGVAASGTFTKAASMNDWPSGGSGIPEGWTVQNA